MSRFKKILCTTLAVLLLAAGGLVWWQWDNIAAVIIGLRYSTQELEEKLAQNDQAVKDAVAAIPEVTVREPTDEERQAFQDGTITREELVQGLIGSEKQPDPATPAPEKPTEETPEQMPEQQPEQPDYEKELAALIAEIYVLREEFLIKLDELMAEAKEKYRVMTPEQRTTANLMPLVSDYLSRGQTMEKECDAKIDEMLVCMEKLLKESKGDMSIVQTVYETYVNEKSLKKAWYMAELKKRGLV